MNIIWAVILSVSLVFAVVNNRLEAFTKAIFDAGKSAIEVSLVLLGIVAIWMGITKILEDAGIVKNLSNLFKPLIKKLFKNIPDDHPSIASITLNLLANFFGLGNAATPLGIKAMNDLQQLNPDKESITFEMMIFIVINTASIQLVPFSVIGILSSFGSANSTWVVLPTILATVISSVTALAILFLFKRFAR